MKRSISLVLCLAMLISVFSCIGVTASAAASAKDLFTVKAGEFKNDKITYTVYLNKGVSLSGAIIYAKFDTNVLAIDAANSGAHMTKDSYGDECYSINGEYVKDFMINYADQFSIAHVYDPVLEYKAGSSNKPYMQFTFKVLDASSSQTKVEFYCHEFNSTSNNIQNGSSALIHTFKGAAAPATLTLSNDNGKVVATWSKVSGATAYRVYRRTVNADGTVSSWKSFDKITATTYSDKTAKSGTTYEYAVRVYSNVGYSALSSEKEIVYLAIPEFSIEATVKGVKITWDKVAGAELYRVYRKVSGGSWSRIKSTSSTSYTDTAAPSGKKVYYMIRAVKGSTTSDYEAQSLTYLKTPSVSIKNTSSGVYASWGKVNGASSYEVYRKAGSAKSWTKIATTKKTSYTDKNVKSGTTYKYTIRAVNSKTKSKYGSTAYETIRFLSAPKLEKITSTKSGVTVYWDDVKGASKYRIYRKTGSGDFELIKTVSGGSTVKYLDKTAKKGKTYTYKVYAGYSSYKSSYKSTLKIKDKY